jgi:tRNA A-37 threonylcarbamoyl transferase component Bud32
MHEHILFHGREAEVLSLSKKGDGTHRVLKLLYKGTPLILKCYGLKTGRLQAALRQYGVRLIIGKSAYSVAGRFHTESEVLALWRREGFDVPGVLSPDFLSDIRQPCLAMEWIPGPTLAAMLRSTEISLDRKKELVAQFAGVMGRRHDRAIAIKEPRLIFEHPTFNHVIVSGDRLVHFDFEIAFTAAGNIERVVRHELAGFLFALPRSHREHFPLLLETLVVSYPDRSRMQQALQELQKYGTVPLLGWLEIFQKYFRLFKRYKKVAAETAMLESLVMPDDLQR